LFKIVLTIRAPKAGGLENAGRANLANWVRILFAISGVFATATKQPQRSSNIFNTSTGFFIR
jgi:hypothetical protein